MPISNGMGIRGAGGVVAIPFRIGSPLSNFYGVLNSTSKPFRSKSGILNTILSGVSRNSVGVALGNCRVMIFTSPDNRFVMETTSDINGVWSVYIMVSGPFYLVEYKKGSPDLAGTSINTLLPAVA